MKRVTKRPPTDEEWLRNLFDYEARHPIAFASPRALAEARLIAAMDKVRRPRRNGASLLHRKV